MSSRLACRLSAFFVLWCVSTLCAAAPALNVNRSSITYAKIPVGSSSTVAMTLTNTGSSTLTLNSLAFNGANPGDFSKTTTCGTTIAAGANCSVNVKFAPVSWGDRKANLVIASNAPGSPVTVALSGTGQQVVVTLSPVDVLGFGAQTLGTTSATKIGSVINGGNLPLNISSITMTGANTSDFILSNGCGSTLTPSGACRLTVSFRPTAAGERRANLVIATNAATSPSTLRLTGAGVVPRPGTISLFLPATLAAQSAGSVLVSVSRLGGTDGAVSVQYATSDGTAVAGRDYTATTGTLKWASGDGVSKTILVPLSKATPFQGGRTFNIALSNPSVATLGSPSTAPVTIYGSVAIVSAADAVRFLEQSSFGPTEATIAAVQTLGIPAYLTQQLNMSPSGYPAYGAVSATDTRVVCPTGSQQCLRNYYSTFPVAMRFFQNAIKGQDQLRQRVAWALAQIFVVSGVKTSVTYAVSDYQQLLASEAFGNFRSLLTDVTLSPMMGTYLDMVNNDKPSGTDNPNENYARELMQLFTIGTVMLNNDGTPKLDGSGNTIPTYDQDTVEGFAHVFTGWTYPPATGASTAWTATPWFRGKMPGIAEHHDTGSKKLLGTTVLPAGQTQDKDLQDAIDNIYNHPNVGPFICKQLIQFLVTSNPTPQYVARVAAVFNNNGHGTRGDLKAVVQAILLDAEARGDVKADPSYGKLREPVLFMTTVLRSLGGTTQSDGQFPFEYAAIALGQNVFSPNTVFNFYPPNYPLAGTSLVAPAMGIYNTNTAAARSDFINLLLSPPYFVPPDPSAVNPTGTFADTGSWTGIAGDKSMLIKKINTIFFHGAMSSTLNAALGQIIDAIPSTDRATRARSALYVALTSPEFQVEQ